MREKRYDVAAQYYRDALAVKLPTSVADQDFLDPWKIAELNRDLSRAEEMVAMVAANNAAFFATVLLLFFEK